MKIRSISFEEFWLQIRKEAVGVEMDVLFEAGGLKMQWSFSDQTKMQKTIKLLKQNGARYQVCQSSVCFWVEVSEQGRLNVVLA